MPCLISDVSGDTSTQRFSTIRYQACKCKLQVGIIKDTKPSTLMTLGFTFLNGGDLIGSMDSFQHWGRIVFIHKVLDQRFYPIILPQLVWSFT